MTERYLTARELAGLLREFADFIERSEELSEGEAPRRSSERPKRGRRHVQPRRNGSGRISDLAREKAKRALGE